MAKRMAGRRWQNALWMFCVALLFALLTGLLFIRLGEPYIADYDEARHGVNAYEMIRNNDYLVSTYQGQTDLWNLKPPLSFWLIALGYRLFGYNAFALRFFSAVSGLLAVLAAAVWAGKRFGRWAAPLVILFITADYLFWGLHFVRYGDADAQYQLFFTLAVLSALDCDRDIRRIYLSALFFGFAFLEKGLHALNIPIVCFFILLILGQLKKLTWKRISLLIATGLLPIVPWAVARFTRDGFQFIGGMFSTDVASRVGSVADPADAGMAAFPYYLRSVFQSPAMLICLALFLLSLPVLFQNRKVLKPSTIRVIFGCAIWVFTPLLAYSLMNVKYCWYVYSCLIAMPTLTVAAVCSAFPFIRWKRTRAVALSAALLACAFFSAQNLASVMSLTFHHTVQEFLREDLDRGTDAGIHTYIQYNEGNRSVWMPGAMLTALFYGDVVCQDGGVNAYLADEGNALLYVCKDNNSEAVNALREQEAVRNEDYYIVAFEK